MKHGFLLCLFVGIFLVGESQNTVKKNTPTNPPVSGPSIKVRVAPLKNTVVYLGSYYGKSRILVDSVKLNEQSEGVFQRKEKYPGGIYFLVSPEKYILQEFLMDQQQRFSLLGDTIKKEEFQILGSEDNTLFLQYTKESGALALQLQQIDVAFQQAKTEEEKNRLRSDYKKFDDQLKQLRFSFVQKNPTSNLSAFLNAMKRPEVPPIPIINGKADSLYPYSYVKEHFWDDVLFNDERLLRTPFFEPKIDEYFSQYVSPDADSIIPEIKFMLLSAKGTKELYPYLLMKFTNKYIQPEYMGQDKVFVYLFEQFYLKGDTTILNTASKKTVFERGYSLIANQIGLPAPQLQLAKKEGGRFVLDDVRASFTFISFWDPNCGHCKETVPRVDSIYNASWKNFGVTLVGVNTDEAAMAEWNSFIKDKSLTNWVHVYQPKQEKEADFKQGIPNYRQLYDIRSTPTFYLLDKDKRIIAKQLSLEQFDQLIKNKSK